MTDATGTRVRIPWVWMARKFGVIRTIRYWFNGEFRRGWAESEEEFAIWDQVAVSGLPEYEQEAAVERIKAERKSRNG